MPKGSKGSKGAQKWKSARAARRGQLPRLKGSHPPRLVLTSRTFTPGDPLPKIVLPDTSGKIVDFSSQLLAGRPTVFWLVGRSSDVAALSSILEPLVALDVQFYTVLPTTNARIDGPPALCDPNNALAHNNLGTALQGKGDLDGAIEHYKQALQIDPKFGDAHFNRGCILAQKNSAATAVAALGRAIELAPRYRDMAKNDTDYDPIRNDSAFRKLVYGE